jgi:predicted aspartyl protease
VTNSTGGGDVRLSGCRVVSFRLAIAAALACAVGAPACAGNTAVPPVPDLLTRYATLVDEPGAPALDRYVMSGTLAGEGLTGTFTSWHDGALNRDDQHLGPRVESVYENADTISIRDSNGNVRELHGVLMRRARTERFIESGDFAKQPQSAVYRGTAKVFGRPTYMLDVTATGGQTETLYLDADTGLADRIAYDDDDGRTTIDLSDWREIDGHRFPFHSVVSNGDHDYDLISVTTSVEPNAAIPAGTFAAPHSRAIEMGAPQQIPLSLRNNHLYVPVTIEGKTYNFLLDSGSANVVVDERVARAAGLREEGALQANGASRTGGLHVAKLDEMTIGTGHLHDLVVATIDLGQSTGGAFRIDGILGYPFFASATVRIDYAKNMLTFGPPGSMPESGTRLDLELDRQIPEATLRLNGELQGQFVVDTGDAAEMLLYRPFVDRNPGIVPFTGSARRSYGLGGETDSYRTALDRLDIGGIALFHTEVDVMQATSGAFADRFDAGNIGLGLLKNFVVTFDDSAGALYVERGSLFDDGRSRAG